MPELKNLVEGTGRAYAASLQRGFDESVGAGLPMRSPQYVQFSEWQHELLEENDDQNRTPA